MRRFKNAFVEKSESSTRNKKWLRRRILLIKLNVHFHCLSPQHIKKYLLLKINTFNTITVLDEIYY